MLSILMGIAGALLGIYRARKRGGNRADMAQYAIGFGLAFFFVTAFASRLAVGLF